MRGGLSDLIDGESHAVRKFRHGAAAIYSSGCAGIGNGYGSRSCSRDIRVRNGRHHLAAAHMSWSQWPYRSN